MNYDKSYKVYCHRALNAAVSSNLSSLLQVNGRLPFAADWYTLSDMDPELVNASSPLAGGAFINQVDGVTIEPLYVPYEKVCPLQGNFGPSSSRTQHN